MNIIQAGIDVDCQIVKLLRTGGIFSRMLELGFTPKSRIKLVQFAPFGGAVTVELRGDLFALRSEIAENIEVKSL